MKRKGETLGKRISRIRGTVYQEEFGKRLGVSQGTVSAWERDDKDRLPSAEMYFRLATLASEPEDQLFFLQEAGLSGNVIMAAAEKIFAHRSGPPSEGEIWGVPIVRRTAQGNIETGKLLPVAARLVEHRPSTVCLIVDEDLEQSTYAPGDMLLLNTHDENSLDLSPFWDQTVLIELRESAEEKLPRWISQRKGILIGKLRCMVSWRDDFFWVAALVPINYSEPKWNLNDGSIPVGSWQTKPPGDLQSFRRLDWDSREVIRKKMEQQARSMIHLWGTSRVLGRFIGWLRPPVTKGKE